MELLDETTMKYTETRGTYGYPFWLLGCSAWVTELVTNTKMERCTAESYDWCNGPKIVSLWANDGTHLTEV